MLDRNRVTFIQNKFVDFLFLIITVAFHTCINFPDCSDKVVVRQQGACVGRSMTICPAESFAEASTRLFGHFVYYGGEQRRTQLLPPQPPPRQSRQILIKTRRARLSHFSQWVQQSTVRVLCKLQNCQLHSTTKMSPIFDVKNPFVFSRFNGSEVGGGGVDSKEVHRNVSRVLRAVDFLVRRLYKYQYLKNMCFWYKVKTIYIRSKNNKIIMWK